MFIGTRRYSTNKEVGERTDYSHVLKRDVGEALYHYGTHLQVDPKTWGNIDKHL